MAICIGGVAFSVLLILIMNGLYQGWSVKMGAYPESIPADLWVEQAGVGDMYHALSFLPDNLSAKLESIEGVRSANKYLGRQAMFDYNGKDRSLFLVGLDTKTGTTKPYKMKEGSWQNLKDGEIIIDQVFAKDTSLKIGDTLDINGEKLRIAGISDGGNIITFSFAFVTMQQAAKMFNLGEKVNFYLLNIDSAADLLTVKNRVEKEISGSKVLTKTEYVTTSKKVITDTFLPIIAVLVVIALAVGIAVIGLTTYSATIEKAREYGVLKAIGLNNLQLFKTVIIQALISGLIGYVVGVGLAYLVGYIATNIVSAFVTLIRPVDLLWVFGATVLMSLIAAYIPMKRIFSIDPAEVFKS
ncbi:MAG: FtsX-like permease family protein [Patescibacteria group bacterium]